MQRNNIHVIKRRLTEPSLRAASKEIRPQKDTYSNGGKVLNLCRFAKPTGCYFHVEDNCFVDEQPWNDNVTFVQTANVGLPDEFHVGYWYKNPAGMDAIGEKADSFGQSSDTTTTQVLTDQQLEKHPFASIIPETHFELDRQNLNHQDMVQGQPIIVTRRIDHGGGDAKYMS
ncbi:hypothetical protein BLNAU_18933 [Blattamonas nauphoetae]|uniref:Uncharacterized protein n=1 Tax=Blattamonas nauphoetae TaxID=2049346 RepID=A0ABQ9X2Z0_9EUKA|nr:hypothetical protein BLNAU_18933 [Blattamonas nauphoetae]